MGNPEDGLDPIARTPEELEWLFKLGGAALPIIEELADTRLSDDPIIDPRRTEPIFGAPEKNSRTVGNDWAGQPNSR